MVTITAVKLLVEVVEQALITMAATLQEQQREQAEVLMAVMVAQVAQQQQELARQAETNLTQQELPKDWQEQQKRVQDALRQQLYLGFLDRGGVRIGDQEKRSDVARDGARSAAAELHLVHADQDLVATTDDFALLMGDVALRIPEAVLIDAFGAEQGHVEVPAGDFLERAIAGDHRVTGQEKTARDVDLDARQARDQLSGRQTGRDDLEIRDAGGSDGFGGEEDGRTGVQVDGHAGLDARGGGTRG